MICVGYLSSGIYRSVYGTSSLFSRSLLKPLTKDPLFEGHHRLSEAVSAIFKEYVCNRMPSKYSHDNSFYRIAMHKRTLGKGLGAATTYHYIRKVRLNCYGFVWKVVLSTHIKAGEKLKTKMQELSDKQGIPVSFDGTPCPLHFVEIFKQPDLKYWMRIQKLEEVEPGDIMVYLPPNHDPSCPPDWEKPTGTHAMFVHSKEGKEGEGMQFSIIDSTRKAHCKEDSRFPKCSGIGNTPLTLIPKDEEQGIYLFQWGSNERQQVKEVVIGRMVSKYS